MVFGEAKWTREPMTEGVLERLIDRGNRWLGGDTGWDVHYALFAREFGQVRESAGQEPGFYLFRPEGGGLDFACRVSLGDGFLGFHFRSPIMIIG